MVKRSETLRRIHLMVGIILFGIPILLRSSEDPSNVPITITTIEKLIHENRISEVIGLLEKDNGLIAMHTTENSSLLHVAAMTNSVRLLDYLVSKKTLHINEVNDEGMTPLDEGLTNNCGDVCIRLLELGANPNKGTPALYYAVKSGAPRYILELLLQKGADPNYLYANGESLLHEYVSLNDWREVNMLLSHGADPNLRDRQMGRTPLQMAAALGSFDVCKSLLEDKADVKLSDDQGNTPLHLAVTSRNIELVNLLLKYHPLLDAQNNIHVTPIYIAVATGQNDMLEVLLKAGASPNCSQLPPVRPPLCLAVDYDDEKAVKLLLDYGAKVNQIDAVGQTALHHFAVFSTNAKIFEMLLKKGADLNEKSAGNKFTPLHIAANVGNFVGAQLLVKHGSQVDAPAAQNETPLFYAVTQGSVPIVKLLLDNNANINAVDDGGSSALHFAAEYNKPEVVEYLLKAGADPNLKDQTGKTPRDWAVSCGFKVVVDIFDRAR
ncbi:MAG: ankyrin repeat domain-containing protein [Planctomycetota bacterium]